MYVLVRGDLSPSQIVVQSGHAILEATRNFISPAQEHPHFVVCTIPNVNQLVSWYDRCLQEGIRAFLFCEPDLGDTPTAFATEVVHDRKPYRRLDTIPFQSITSHALPSLQVMTYYSSYCLRNVFQTSVSEIFSHEIHHYFRTFSHGIFKCGLQDPIEVNEIPKKAAWIAPEHHAYLTGLYFPHGTVSSGHSSWAVLIPWLGTLNYQLKHLSFVGFESLYHTLQFLINKVESFQP